MKKSIIFPLFFLVFSFNLFAQKGTVLVAGNINYATQSRPSSITGNPNNTGKLFALEFTGGYQFTQTITGGIVAGVGSSNSKTGTSEDRVNQFAAGPFIRYTKTLSDIFAVYGQFQALFGSEKNTTKDNFSSSETKFSFYKAVIYPAVFINVKNGFGINLAMGAIGFTSTKPKGGSSTNEFRFGLGQSFIVGISKNF